MRWLLEGFEQGMGREENIFKANQYADSWGEDKILNRQRQAFLKPQFLHFRNQWKFALLEQGCMFLEEELMDMEPFCLH